MPSLEPLGERVAGSSKGYRNGTYPCDLVTTSGRIEDLQVPRDREGQFHTQVFDRYSRYEPHIAEGLIQMFVAGTSTHKVGEVAQTLMGVAPSASTISRLNQTLTQQFDTWRQRPRPRALACALPRWRAFQHSSRRQGRCHHHFDRLGSGSGRQQRGVGPTSLRAIWIKRGGLACCKTCALEARLRSM